MLPFPLLGTFAMLSLSIVSSSQARELTDIYILPSTTALALSPENTYLSPLPPFNPSTNATGSLNLTGGTVKCDPHLGQELTIASCQDASAQLGVWLRGLRKSKITIGQQGTGVWDVNDRIKFLSGKYNCTVALEENDGL